MREILSQNSIKKHLSSTFDVEVFDVISSTNTLAKDMAKDGKTQFIISARAQEKGRGRFARKFHSPKDCGLYFSVVITPESQEEISFITPLCAVACADAIRDLCEKNAVVKWVNDVYIDGKKCVGILCEGVSSTGGDIDRIVMGIGVNLVEQEGGADEEIKDIIGYVGEVSPNKLLAKITDNIFDLHTNFDKKRIAERYKQLSFLIGEEVGVLKGEDGEEKFAIVEDIDEECRLAVRYSMGERETLSCGEVHLRLK